MGKELLDYLVIEQLDLGIVVMDVTFDLAMHAL
jgi:hypothetical protein